ncbi:MAG: hypothetical protein IIC18_08910, partial [Bacteroidetes bacterium]|nr:hypothetical protein [Bacteroidota bacterium]
MAISCLTSPRNLASAALGMALLLPSEAVGQTEFPEAPFDCTPVDWTPIGYQVQPPGRELALLFDAVDDCEDYRATDGDNHGLFMRHEETGGVFAYLFIMPLQAGVPVLSPLWASADHAL